MIGDDLDGAFRTIVWIISELGSIVKREELGTAEGCFAIYVTL